MQVTVSSVNQSSFSPEVCQCELVLRLTDLLDLMTEHGGYVEINVVVALANR